ncbi:MAG: hypothetical protein KDD62_10545 [Bdellovibrionales bacterium]|nr:hypothetical protein [Bdellovibrionales bacterium]
MNSKRERRPSEVLKRGYSDAEVENLYALGRFYLENGELGKAKNIMAGLVEVAPDYYHAWLGLAYIHIYQENYDQAIFASRQALRANPQSIAALLYQVACLLCVGDYNAAGTYLGEVGEKIEAGKVDRPELLRFYKAQLARYNNRRAQDVA